MRAVLQSYLTLKLLRDIDEAASLYHAFAIVSYFMPLPGAILADSFIGRYWTIFSLSIVYVIGNVIMATTAIGPGYFEGALVGMFTIAVGTGGIKPCVSAFGSDQFKLPEQEFMQKSFFSMFYISINAGSLISQFVTPIIKSTPCLGDDECWVLAFGLPAVLMVFAVVFFVIGSPFYTKAPVTENVVVKMMKAIWKALGRSCGGDAKPVNHWLDRAVPDFSQRFVDDCKIVLKVLLLYTSLPFFYALFEQQGSRWTYQAQKMNSYIDFLDIHMEAEQIQIFNSALCVILVVVFDTVVYPIFAKCNLLKKPLQRMVTGCFLTALSFVIIGFIQFGVDNGMDVLAKNKPSTYRARFFNLNPNCHLRVASGELESEILTPYDTFLLPAGHAKPGSFIEIKDITCSKNNPGPMKFELQAFNDTGYMSSVFFNEDNTLDHIPSINPFPTDKKGNIQNEFLFQILTSAYTPLKDSEVDYLQVVLRGENITELFTPGTQANVAIRYSTDRTPSQSFKLRYKLRDGDEKLSEPFTLYQGGAYTFYFTRNRLTDEYEIDLLVDKEHNKMSVYWQGIPYFVITCGEIFFSITGLAFAISQAPSSMKSILTAGWLLTHSFGNVIDLIIINIKLEDKAFELFLFAGLMFIVTIIFGIQSYFYVPSPVNNNPDEDNMDEIVDNPKEMEAALPPPPVQPFVPYKELELPANVEVSTAF